MLEKIGHIRNPLSIIAIFAGIAEISGAGVLPFIAPATQGTYVWFLILFPFYLVTLFFVTLIFKRQVLYAPSDYKNEDNFFRRVTLATFDEIIQRRAYEVAEEEKGYGAELGSRTALAMKRGNASPPVASTDIHTPQKDQDSRDETHSIVDSHSNPDEMKKNVPNDSESFGSFKSSSRIISEELFVNLLHKRNKRIIRNVVIKTKDSRILFDAIDYSRSPPVVYEFKYTRHLDNDKLDSYAKELNKRIHDAEITDNVLATIMIAIDGNHQNIGEGPKKFLEIMSNVEFNIYTMHDLRLEVDDFNALSDRNSNISADRDEV